MMKPWSLKTSPDNWRIKIYFDTNILIHLSDNTHSGLKHAVTYFNEKSVFADIISSEYALFEFLENRKKKHYKAHLHHCKIREPNNNFKLFNNVIGRIGLALIKADSNSKWNKYYSYNISGYSYLKVYSEINKKVESEISSLREDTGINYEDNLFNEDLFQPTKQLCLSSRISRQDCLITTSAVYPKNSLIAEDVIIWTADEDYYKAFNECPEAESIFGHFPRVEWTKRLRYTNNTKIKEWNLDIHRPAQKVQEFLKLTLLDYIKSKHKDVFIGYTVKAPKAKDVIYISVENQFALPEDGIFLNVVGKDLDFYISSKKIDSFWMDGKVLEESDIQSFTADTVISAMWNYPEAHQSASADIIEILKQPGHLVFFSS